MFENKSFRPAHCHTPALVDRSPTEFCGNSKKLIIMCVTLWFITKCPRRIKMKGKSSGYTLIELMVVLSISGMLTTMALPSFQDQIIRTQAKEALNLAQMAVKGIEHHYNQKKSFPEDNELAGLPASEKIIGNYVSRVEVENGVINVTLGNRVNKNAEDKIISIRPAIVENEPSVPIAWVCGYASVPNGMKVIGANSTSMLKRHLPMSCTY